MLIFSRGPGKAIIPGVLECLAGLIALIILVGESAGIRTDIYLIYEEALYMLACAARFDVAHSLTHILS